MTEDFIASDFRDSLPKQVLGLLDILWSKNYYPYFTGGTVRDFILLQQLSKDIDVELHFQDDLDESLRVSHWDALFMKLAGEYKVERLPYDVYRIKLDDHEVELSQPRTERFSTKGSKSHHDFHCALHAQLPLRDSFKRRDFTINAMAIGLKKNGVSHFYDPYEGLKDLKLNRLNACSDSFVHDPVRFLRAIRFYFKYGFKISDDLLNKLSIMNLEQVSHFYVWQEAIKSGRFYLFLRKIGQLNTELPLELKNIFKIILEQEEKLDDWYSRLLRYFSTQEKGKVAFLALALDTTIKLDSKIEICDYFQVPSKFLKRIESLKNLALSLFAHSDLSKVFDISNNNFDSFTPQFLEKMARLKKLVGELNWLNENHLSSEQGQKTIFLLEEVELLVKPEFDFDAQNLYFLLKGLAQKISVDSSVFEENKIPTNRRSEYMVYLQLKNWYSDEN